MAIRSKAGFTLTELLVASLIFLIVLSGIYAFFRGQLYGIKAEEARLSTVQGARVGIDFMTREIRNAGYNPSGVLGCGAVLIAQGKKIQVVSNTNENLICGTVLEPSEDVTYDYDSAEKQITRDGQPLVENVPADGFSLTYYRADGSQIALTGTPPSVPALDLPSIRGIAIRITPQVKHPDPWVGGTISTSMAAYVNRRNP
jgi:type IV pilus assembly protein PilW